jgi:short-subunit dehydrogenase
MTPYASALVTGASSGIGEQIARVLGGRGCRLVLVARRADRLAGLADELGRQVDVECVDADLTTHDGLERVATRLQDRPVELLVNNAGVSTGGDFHELPIEPELAEIALNVVALTRLTHAALPAMVRAGRGGILNVSSIAGNQPLPGFVTYCSTKSFVTTFSEALAAEHRHTGVHVTLLKPGYVFTEMTDGSQPSPDSATARLLWLQPDRVAAEAVDAVERGKLNCVPGATWKAANAATTGLPRALVRVLSSRVRAD